MLKNYVVRIANVKAERLNTFVKYLNNTEHKNHAKHNTSIKEYSNKQRFLIATSEKLFLNREAFKKRARGGRKLKVVGKSLTFNIPPKFEFNNDIADYISEEIKIKLKELYNSFGYELEEWEIYSVLHKQKNPHYHIIIPYLDTNGKPIKDIKPKSFLNKLKLAWNEIMINAYQVDLEQYQPLDQDAKEIGKNRRFLEELEEYYKSEDFESDKYIKNQRKRIKRLLALNDDALEASQSDLESIEHNLEKVLKNYKKNNGPTMTMTKD